MTLTYHNFQPTVPVVSRMRPGHDPFIDDAITHDRSGTAYTLQDGHLMVAVGGQWEAYRLPPHKYARIEVNDHPTRRPLTPAVMLDDGRGGLSVVIITKTADRLDLDQIDITSRSLFAVSHSGAGNRVISTREFVFVAWSSNVPPKSGIGTTQYITTIDRQAKALVRTEQVGVSQTAKPADNHDIPAITMTDDGTLHVLLGAHHGDLLYSHSTGSGWDGFTEPAAVGLLKAESGGGHTYPALVSDRQNRLHVVTRYAGERYHFQLAYNRREADGTWAEQQAVVGPGRSMYVNWYHRFGIDYDDRLILTSPGPLWGQLRAGEIAVYNDLWPGELPTDAQPYPGGASWYPTQKRHDPFMLTSMDGGETWSA